MARYGRSFCSRKCYYERRPPFTCETCQAEFRGRLGGPHRRNRFCSNACQGQARTKAALGKKKRTKAGYVLVFQPSHPAANSGGYVLEHRLVMERIIGRPLFEDEKVHHKNGDRADNRRRNLELWSTSQPAGQRVEDKLAWAQEIIERYAA